MADNKSGNSRPSSAQGALLLMQDSDRSTTAPAPSILVPYVPSDTSALFSDDDAEADSFVGQSTVSDEINFFTQSSASQISDPFGQIQQPVPLNNLLSRSPINTSAVQQQQLHGLPRVNPYAAGASIVSSRSAHYVSLESHQSDQKPLHSLSAQGMTSAAGHMPFNVGASQPVLTPFPSFSAAVPGAQQPPSVDASQLLLSAQPVAPSIYAPVAPSQRTELTYQPIAHHWFYSVLNESKELWEPFSYADSQAIEEVFLTDGRQTLSVEGGRFDVNVASRRRVAIYWNEESRIRRCSWFYRPDGDNRFVPFDEQFSANLEESYRNTLYSGDFHKRLMFPGGESIVIHNPQTVIYFSASSQPDAWGNTANGSRPNAVKRGLNDSDCIPDSESKNVDHLVLVVLGAGVTCDLRLRNVIDYVNDFRSTSSLIMKSHFEHATCDGRIGRVEFLPVIWHEALHGDLTIVDSNLKKITLTSIKKLRSFTNDTLLDVLFFASPNYAQTIVDIVGNEINRLVQLFSSRNPSYKGGISLSGHNLGAILCFDILMHQKLDTIDNNSSVQAKVAEMEDEDDDEGLPDTLDSVLCNLGLSSFLDQFRKEQVDVDALSLCDDNDMKEMGLPLGPRKKLQGYLREYKDKQVARKAKVEQKAKELAMQAAQHDALSSRVTSDPSSCFVPFIRGEAGIGTALVVFPQLCFKPVNFFALGSPISMFLALRGVRSLGEDFSLPTCPAFFNIFHPFDPVAYRIEPMVVANCPLKPLLIPHHKGRKRLHLELKESLARMGSDLKQRIIESVKATWNSIHSFAQAHKTIGSAPLQEDDLLVEKEVEDVLSEMNVKADDDETEPSIASSVADEDELPYSCINQGRRVDYVLQEKPIEVFNDYLFAFGSQNCYWRSEDTALLMLKEIYIPLGVSPIRPNTGGMFQTLTRIPAGPPPRIGFVAQPVLAASKQGPFTGPPVQGLGQPLARPPLNQSPYNSAGGSLVQPPPLRGFVKK